MGCRLSTVRGYGHPKRRPCPRVSKMTPVSTGRVGHPCNCIARNPLSWSTARGHGCHYLTPVSTDRGHDPWSGHGYCVMCTELGSPYATGPLSCLSCTSVCNVGHGWCTVLWPNGWMDQDATWHTDRSWPRQHCISWRSSSIPPAVRSTTVSSLSTQN